MYWIGLILSTIFEVALVGFALIGAYTLYVGMRMKKSAGSSLDLSAFWFNFLAFMWMWAERTEEIVQAMPFFKRDLSETLGVKEDDGNT